ncbi:MAG: LLM class flavin-dependent oxidoreductase [Anaerolineaceae bacterium]|nr:LLM class flavin-dependent oxidoreductase [Anaerolineaceae bacterium]MDE0330212.1 LLM class flavin-dependent oxidoreductase [Anaerolineaceae bacterium]
MRFGFGFVPSLPPADSLRVVRLGERLGYEMAWIPDQTFYRDPFLVMAHWAQATENIQLMIGVTNPYTRHPAQVARAIATVDEMSGGRANLGIGSGNRRELLLPMGHEQDAAAARSREMLILVRALLRGETLHHDSPYVTAKDLQLTWTPERADIPIYIAARGARMLEAAGELADGGAIGALVSEDGLDYAFGALERGAARAGRSLGDFEIVSWVTCRVVDDEAAAHERLKPSVAHIIGGAPLSLLRAIGMKDGYIADLKRAYAAGGPTGAAPLVTRREIDMLTIVGSAARVRETCERLAQRGVGQIGILLTGADADSNCQVLERIARDVMPHFR